MDPSIRSDPQPAPEVIRSEEEVVSDVLVTPYERVRISKRIVSETVTRTFEVRREELHVERFPLDPGADAGAGEEPQELELVLREEEAVVSTRVVPRERVRVRKELVTEQRTVDVELGRERVEVELDGGAGRPAGEAPGAG
jgi:uncharacterized protein (TIGR02271 family)